MPNQAAMSYSERSFQPVVEKCDGCERIVEESGAQYCQSYLQPESKWRLGICNFATHAKQELKVVKIRINPLKAAKRASANKV